MRIAIIDCGTNTFHLLIVEKPMNGIPRKIFKTKAIVKLGEDGITKKYIAEVPFERGIRALENFRRLIKIHKAEKIIAFGTAAIRNAQNRNDFILSAKQRAGIAIDLITGNREAELIYRGVKASRQLSDRTSLIIDIGGGSTEFIICNDNKIFWRKSFKLGASLLVEKLQPSDPINADELRKLNVFLASALSSLFNACLKFQPKELIGSSGSFDTLAEMISQRKGISGILKGRTGYDFIMRDYRGIHRLLIKSTIAERKKMKGLIKMRVDMIVLASLLLTFVLSLTGIRKMKLSTYALKEGMLSELSN